MIAEGVETGEQLARLRALSCHEGQGTYFAAPLEAQEAEGLLLGGARWHLPPTRRAHG